MKRIAALGFALIFLATSLMAQTRLPASPWTLRLSPTFGLPLTDESFSANEVFSASYGASLGVDYALKAPFAIRMAGAYSATGFLPTGSITTPGSLGEISLMAGLGLSKPLSSVLSLQAYLDGGAVYGILPTGVSSIYGAFRLGGGLELGLGYGLLASLLASYDYRAGLYSGIGASLSMGFRLPAAKTSIQAPLRLLDLTDLKLGGIFPIFRSYYDQHAVGTLKIANTSAVAVQNVKVSFLIKQYMDAPKDCGTIRTIEAGKTVDVPLYALFNDSILAVTEATKVNAQITVDYGDNGEQTRTATVLVYDRNALTWSDDRHAAAFVSNKDPWVQDLTGHILAAVKSDRNPELGRNLQTAIAIHQGLGVYGLGYMISTARPASQEAWNPEVVDTLKFPRQTLAFRAGDCADLSVLYASCFEAAGIETAFITVPGHILMAIDLGMDRLEALARRLDLSQLIEKGGRLWLPIETTMRDAGFLEVWRKGAEEWRLAQAKGQAAFYPIHEAWQTYAPVGLPADGSIVAAPADSAINASFKAELARVADAELGARLSALGPIPADGQQAASTLNSRGILFGKYGRFAEATRDFQAAAKAGSRAAVVNLGNISYMKGDYQAALGYFQQAAKQSPQNAKILVSLARAAASLGKTDLVNSILDTMKKLDPQAAEQYAGLAAASNLPGTRAAQQDASALEWF